MALVTLLPEGLRGEQVANRKLQEGGMAQEAKAQSNVWDMLT
jgi:hypothetical protein